MSASREIFKGFLSQLEDLIQAGQLKDARLLLKKITLREIPRVYIQAVASFARRAELPGLGLKLLNPIVRPQRKKMIHATELEKIEYAFCLSNCGAQKESLDLLETIEVPQTPQALLAKSSALIQSWNAKDAISLLKTYVVSPAISHFDRLAGQVSLVSAFVYEGQTFEADILISKLLKDTERFNLLHGKLLCYQIQNCIQAKNWGEAEKILQKTATYLTEMEEEDLLLFSKWNAIFHCYQKDCHPDALEELKKVREKAFGLKNWETVRHCDFYRATLTKNIALAHRLYFGTPYASFRNKLNAEFENALLLPNVYPLALGPASGNPQKLNFLIEEMSDVKSMKHGQASHRALLALASDFYRPLRVTTLHSALYPDEFFNPFSSRDRVHQVLRRLRLTLKQLQFPLAIEEADGLYSLTAKAAVQLFVPKEVTAKDRTQFQMESLQTRWPSETFSVSQAASHLQIETRTALILLQKALEQGEISRTGKGPATRYAFEQSKSVAA